MPRDQVITSNPISSDLHGTYVVSFSYRFPPFSTSRDALKNSASTQLLNSLLHADDDATSSAIKGHMPRQLSLGAWLAVMGLWLM